VAFLQAEFPCSLLGIAAEKGLTRLGRKLAEPSGTSTLKGAKGVGND